MSKKFYNHAKDAMNEIEGMLDKLEKSESMVEISTLEVAIRKKAEEIMVYAGMIPNKDAMLTSFARRKVIRGSAISAADRVREILAEEEEEKPVVSKTQRRKKAAVKKEARRKKGTK